VIPTTQASSFRLQYFVYYVWCSMYSCLFFFLVNLLSVYYYFVIILFYFILFYGCNYQYTGIQQLETSSDLQSWAHFLSAENWTSCIAYRSRSNDELAEMLAWELRNFRVGQNEVW
jgi:hypothetical protein